MGGRVPLVPGVWRGKEGLQKQGSSFQEGAVSRQAQRKRQGRSGHMYNFRDRIQVRGRESGLGPLRGHLKTWGMLGRRSKTQPAPTLRAVSGWVSPRGLLASFRGQCPQGEVPAPTLPCGGTRSLPSHCSHLGSTCVNPASPPNPQTPAVMSPSAWGWQPWVAHPVLRRICHSVSVWTSGIG